MMILGLMVGWLDGWMVLSAATISLYYEKSFGVHRAERMDGRGSPV